MAHPYNSYMARFGERTSARFSAERNTAVRGVSAVEYRRAEILALIARLQQHASGEFPVPGVRRAVERNANAPTPAAEPSAVNDGTTVAHAATNALSKLKDLERRVSELEHGTQVPTRPQRSIHPTHPQLTPAAVPSIAVPSIEPRDRPSNAVIAGVIRGQLLSDVLQLLSSNSMTGVFTVECRRAQTTLYFDAGRIVHAEGSGLEGEQAFFSIFAFEGGRYYFQETSELPAQRTINSNTQFLILEALRQIDESRAG